jgi:hypothetical protein
MFSGRVKFETSQKGSSQRGGSITQKTTSAQMEHYMIGSHGTSTNGSLIGTGYNKSSGSETVFKYRNQRSNSKQNASNSQQSSGFIPPQTTVFKIGSKR